MQNGRNLTVIMRGAGWLLGLVAAGFADYLILPPLAAKLGGRVIPAAIGLLVGSITIYVFVVAARLAADWLMKEKESRSGEKIVRRKTPAEQISLGSRIMIGLLAVVIAAGMLMGDHGLSLLFK